MSVKPTTASVRQLATVWVAVAVLFALLLGLAETSETGLDDPDPARQRPGFLDAGAMPITAPELPGGLPRRGRPMVAFFVDPARLPGLCRSLARADAAMRADVVVVVSGSGRCPGFTTLMDPALDDARGYGLPSTRSGEAPVGYVVVDGQGRIRYRTLDPTVADHLTEVDTVVRATR